MSRLLFDLTDAPTCCTDHALEELHKSLADGGGSDIWAPHHDPLIAGHIEAVTSRGLALLSAIRDHVAGNPLTKSLWRRTPEALSLEKQRLDAKPRALYTFEDWVALIDWALQTYLSDAVVQSEAEYLAVRSTFIGALQASLDMDLSDEALAKLAGVTPTSIIGMNGIIRVTGRQAAVLRFAQLRAADLIVDVGELARRQMRASVLRYEERRALGERIAPNTLERELFDQFDVLNRDWRRIAVTEVGRNANEGFIASVPIGSKVRRLEVYESACAFCKKIHGMVFTVVSPDKVDKDGWKEVWSGKSNVGRSASPKKRVGNELVDRMPEELWHVAAGVQHPHCRGRWLLLKELPKADKPFEDWVAAKLAAAQDDIRMSQREQNAQQS